MKHCPGLLKDRVSSLTAPTRSYIVKGWASVSSLTGKNPNKVQGNDDVSMWREHEKKTWAVMCLWCFRPWRLAQVRVRLRNGCEDPWDNNWRSGLTSGIRSTVHASETATQRTQTAGERRCAPGLHARRSDQIWASLVPYLGKYVTQESI